MDLESRLRGVPRATAEGLKAITDAFVVEPAIRFFVPAAQQQQQEYSGLDLIYEFIAGAGLMIGGAVAVAGSRNYDATLGFGLAGAALTFDALGRFYIGTLFTDRQNPTAAIPIEICYGLFRAGRELFHSLHSF